MVRFIETVGREQEHLAALTRRRRSVYSRQPVDRWRSGFSERAVEIVGCADKREMGEGLREVAERFAARADLFCVQAEMVRIAEHALEKKARFVEPRAIHSARAGECFHQPGGAHAESTFAAFEAIGAMFHIVAKDECVGDK